MINKYIFLFITIIAAYEQQIYGVLEQNEMKNFTVANYNGQLISFLSFQGPIQFAKVAEDGKLIELKPVPDTYFFYDYLNDTQTNTPITYVAYGSKGGATYPQYRFQSQYSYQNYQVSSLMRFENQPIKYKSEKGYLILDIPMVLKNDGQLIKSASFLISVGHKKDEQMLKLSSYQYYKDNRPIDCFQSNDNKMTFSNYYTTVYLEMDPRDNYDYFAVMCEDFSLPLGGSTFNVNYSDPDSHIWIWILVSLIVVLLLVIIGFYMNNQKRKKQLQEDQENCQQTFQQFN